MSEEPTTPAEEVVPEVVEEAKFEPDLSQLDTDQDDKYIVTEDLDPTPIKYAIADDTYAVQPERYDTRKKAEAELKKLGKGYTIVETR